MHMRVNNEEQVGPPKKRDNREDGGNDDGVFQHQIKRTALNADRSTYTLIYLYAASGVRRTTRSCGTIKTGQFDVGNR